MTTLLSHGAICLLACLGCASQEPHQGDHAEFLRKWGGSPVRGMLGRPSSALDAIQFLRVASENKELSKFGLKIGVEWLGGNGTTIQSLSQSFAREFTDRLWLVITSAKELPENRSTAVRGLAYLAAHQKTARKRLFMLVESKKWLPGTLTAALESYNGLSLTSQEVKAIKARLGGSRAVRMAAAIALTYGGKMEEGPSESVLIEMLESVQFAEVRTALTAVQRSKYFSCRVLKVFISWLDGKTVEGESFTGDAIYALVAAGKVSYPALILYIKGNVGHPKLRRHCSDGIVRAILAFASVGRTRAAYEAIRTLCNSRNMETSVPANALLAAWAYE